MSIFTRALIAFAAVLFLAITVGMSLRGQYMAAAMAAGLACFILFMGGMAWFERKYPLPPLPRGETPTLTGEARRYFAHYPGTPGKVAAFVVGTVVLLGVLAFILRVWNAAHV